MATYQNEKNDLLSSRQEPEHCSADKCLPSAQRSDNELFTAALCSTF